MTIEWQEFFRVLSNRVGGIDAPTITETDLSIVSELYSTPKNYNNTRNRTIRITNADSPYAVLLIDEVIFCNTDGGAIEIDLIAGIEGKHYKIINNGSSGNDLTIDPFGIEEIFGGGAGVARILMDGDILDMHYGAIEGWW